MLWMLLLQVNQGLGVLEAGTQDVDGTAVRSYAAVKVLYVVEYEM